MRKLFNKDNRLKALVVTLIITTVALFGVSYSVFAKTSGSVNDGAKTTSSTPTDDENVYVMTKANGDSYQRIVSADGTLHYKGYESYTLPISMKVTYTLDGQKVTAKELAGESGHVVIHISYTNNIRSGGVNVPFMVVTGLALNDEHFSNVSVNNGKAMDDGSRNLVMGYSFPGMQSSLGLSTSDFTIPESVTISADTDDFQVDAMYTLVSNEPFKDLNIKGTDSLSTIKSKLGTLKSSANKLVNGTDQLYAGTVKLASGANKLSAASNTLKTGAKSLNSGTSQLATGAKTLMDGSNKLVAGAKSVYEGNESLLAGLNSLYGKDASVDGTQKLAAGANSLYTALNASYEQLGAASAMDEVIKDTNVNKLQANKMVDPVTKTLIQLTSAGYDKELSTAIEDVNTVISQVDGAISKYEEAMDSTSDAAVAKGAYAQIKQYEATKETLIKEETALSSIKTSLDDINNQIFPNFRTSLKSAVYGASQVSTGATKINKAVGEQLIPGATLVTAGAKTLYDGTLSLQSGGSSLVSGVSKLNAGSMTLYKGTITFSSKQAELAKGANQLKSGAKTLDDGLNTAMDKVSGQLSKLSKSNLINVAENAESIQKAGKSYNSFGSGSYKAVTFIYKMDEVSPK
jgi:putative membrane protein